MERSAAAGVATRALVAAAGAGVLATVHLPRPATLCPLRATTGLPCPLCGGTTALARLGRLDLVGALLANPFVVAGLVLLVLAPLARGRRLMPPPAALVLLAGTAWAWQLARAG